MELETDKVTLEVSAPESGRVSEITHKTGDTVEIGAVLGFIDSSAVVSESIKQQRK